MCKIKRQKKQIQRKIHVSIRQTYIQPPLEVKEFGNSWPRLDGMDLSSTYPVLLLILAIRSTPVQYKLCKGGEVIRTDIRVGDDTRPYFSVSIWQRQMGSLAVAGDIVLLENVKITKFQDVVEAKTVQCSSLQCLVHPDESFVSRGVDDIIGACRIGLRTREKLRKVIEWVQKAGHTLRNVGLHGYQLVQHTRHQLMNWKENEERDCQDCFSLLEVSCLSDSREATFYASIGELFLPMTWNHLHESEDERMFISRRLYIMGDHDLVDDFICTGCQLCGSPLNSDSGSTCDDSTLPLYCQKSSNYHHFIGKIYRPFMLYVWDDSKYIPLLVKDKAAELLFGNIKAERVYSSFREKKCGQTPYRNKAWNIDDFDARATTQPNQEGLACSVPPDANKSLQQNQNLQSEMPNFYMIWLILLKLLFQQKNYPLKFKVGVNVGRDIEGGRFEMVSVSMPCFGTVGATV